MIEMILEGVIVASALMSASLIRKSSPKKARKIYAITFLLVTATCIAFTVAQAAASFGFLDTALSYTPFQVLSLLAVIYWVSFAVSKGTMFDKMVGEEGN